MFNRLALLVTSAISMLLLVFSGAAIALLFGVAVVLLIIPTIIFFGSLASLQYVGERI